MPTVAEVFALALDHHQKGDLRRAEHLCQIIVQAEPRHADAHHFLGVLAYHTGRFEQAITSIRKALALDGQNAVYHCNLGLAQQSLGQLDEAVASYQKSLSLHPELADAHNNLANALLQQGKTDQAIVHFEEALRLRPQSAESHNNLGMALVANERLEEAVDHYQQAVRLNPDFVVVQSNLGFALTKLKRREEAIASYEKVVRLCPNVGDAHFNLGVLYAETGKLQEAEAAYRRVLSLLPEYAEAWNNLGETLKQQGQLDEALAHFQQAARLKPDYHQMKLNLALMQLLHGEWERAWSGYESRWDVPDIGHRYCSQPLWDGSDLHGRTLVLYAEQGLGDTMHFIRYVPMVRRRGGRIILLCYPPLLRLLNCVPGIDRLDELGSELEPFDVHASLLSLPGLFCTTLDNVPAEIPYLQANDKLVAHWREELERLCPHKGRVGNPSYRVGIAWQGNVEYPYDRYRSIRLELFARLAKIDGIELISLQKGPGSSQLSAISYQPEAGGEHVAVRDLSPGLDEASGAFMDTAAVMKNLDLVISSDTAIAHLAGALGVPVWVALPLVPDWRWLLERKDCPWYPTMRLFRQVRFGQWDDVFDRMATEIRCWLKADS